MNIAHWISAAALLLGLSGAALAGPDPMRPGPHHDRGHPHASHHHAPPSYRPPPPHYHRPPPPAYRHGPYYVPPVVQVRRGYRLPPGHWGPPPVYYSRNLYHRPGYEWRRVNSDVVLVSIATGVVAEVIYNAIR